MSEFPAPAGINRVNSDDIAFCQGVPRASGDKPVLLARNGEAIQSSPRQRG